MTIQEISDLLDTKLDEKIKPVVDRLDNIKAELKKVLAFVSTGNEDIVHKLPKMKKVTR